MTRKHRLFSLSKAKIKELLEEVHFGNWENNADQGTFAKTGDLSQNDFAEATICPDNVLQTSGTFQSENAQEVAPDEDSSAYQDESHFDNGGLDAIECENNSLLIEEEDTRPASKNSIESAVSHLNNSHQVSENNSVLAEQEVSWSSSKDSTESTAVHLNNNHQASKNNAILGEQEHSRPSSKNSMGSTVSDMNNIHRISESNVVFKQRGDSRSSSKNSMGSTGSHLNNNHQVSKNRKPRNIILKGPAPSPVCTGNAIKNLAKKCAPKSGERDLKNFITCRSKDNFELENPVRDGDSVDEEKNISRNNGEATKENQTAFYTTSPTPAVANGVLIPDGDQNILDQEALASHIFPQMEDIESSPERMKAKIEELQICLLESSMEYEIKILELKMNMLQNKSQHPHMELDSLHTQLDPEHSEKMQLAVVQNDLDNFDKSDARSLDYSKIQKEKEALTKEVVGLRKIERQFEIQRRNFHYAIQRVNWLQRELSRKEEQLVDCQSREMEAKARLREIQIGLQSAQAARTENRKLSNLIPSLADWLQSLKKIEAVKCDEKQMLQVRQYEASLARILEECLPPSVAQNQPKRNQELSTSRLGTRHEKIRAGPAEERMEVQALQRELEKLACCR